jgi:acyl-CoA synthetase (AMP-forming)/AMP-acid ligase II
MKITRRDVFVSWLPVFHDMGLILKTMVPFYLPAKLVLLPTSLTNVRTWLKTIDTHRATFTAAPDFAYRLCLRYVRNAESYDLSSLRVALNAAEPVRSTTIREFESAFGLHNVIAPAYGLAEATVGVTMWPPGTATLCDQRGLVSVGFPFPGITLRIDRNGSTLPDGEIGRILIKSPANTRGYWDNPDATAELLQRDGYIDSGDSGYLDDHGRLFIAGREKNIIITAGRTIAPQEIEEIVDALPQVRFSAALGIDRGRVEGEQLYVFAEIRANRPESSLEDTAVAIVSRIHAGLGLRPGRVYLLKPRSIPQTHNGKIQHHLLKNGYLSGALREDGLILFPDY